MTSGGGSKGYGVVLSPGVGPGPRVRQSITISAPLSDIQCGGFASPSACPTGGTLIAALTSGPVNCATLATQTTRWRGELTITWAQGGGATADTVVAPFTITFVRGIFYGLESGTVASGLQVLGTESGTDVFTPKNGGCGTTGAPLRAMSYVAQMELRVH
jgi:hypothetical protein